MIQSNDFDVEEKNALVHWKFQDEELVALLHKDLCQEQAELAESLGVDHITVSKCLIALWMIQKQRHWVPYELKLKDVEWCLVTCEQVLHWQKRKDFLHRTMTSDKKWIHYNNSKHRRSWGKLGYASKSVAKLNIHGLKLLLCIWWDQLGEVYYEQLKPTKTTTGDCCWLQLMHLSWTLKK